MSFSAFADSPIRKLIDEAASSNRLSVLLGAGASIEAGLPNWSVLIERLLVRAGRHARLLSVDNELEAERWVEEAIRQDGYPGAAAIVGALAGDLLDAWIPEELYGAGKTAADYFPGAICRQLPRLADSFGTGLELFTLNYDDLVEQAFRDDAVQEREAVPFVGEHVAVPEGGVEVMHLHGFAGREGRRGDLILTEGDYQAMQRTAGWQQARVQAALAQGMFVFVGTSLVDPNLLRYLYSDASAAGPPRYAIFVRQGAYEHDVPPGVPAAREAAVAARWSAVGVTAVFVDHYVDVAQLLYEMSQAKARGNAYVALPDRARAWTEVIQRDILGFEGDDPFVNAQNALNRQLRSALQRAVEAAGEVEGREWDEKLALSLWLVDPTGERLTNWVTTDRLHIDRGTIEPVAIDEHARWLAVRSYCQGVSLAEARDIYASRWRFIRGTPLVVKDQSHGRMPVGVLTTTSMRGRNETLLNDMEDVVEARFNQALESAVLSLLSQPFN